MIMWRDIIYAIRRLAAKPGFSLIALLTLTLGVGFNAAIFTFVNAFLLRPLPVAQPDRLMSLGFARSRGADCTCATFIWESRSPSAWSCCAARP